MRPGSHWSGRCQSDWWELSLLHHVFCRGAKCNSLSPTPRCRPVMPRPCAQSPVKDTHVSYTSRNSKRRLVICFAQVSGSRSLPPRLVNRCVLVNVYAGKEHSRRGARSSSFPLALQLQRRNGPGGEVCRPWQHPYEEHGPPAVGVVDDKRFVHLPSVVSNQTVSPRGIRSTRSIGADR